MNDQLVTGLLIVAAFAFTAWPHVRRALGIGPYIAVDKLAARLERGDPTLIVDVRSPAETAEGSVPGAVAIPLPELPSRIHELLVDIRARPETAVVLVCARGARAERALPTVVAAGVTKVAVLQGGLSGWRKAGLSVKSVSTPK